MPINSQLTDMLIKDISNPVFQTLIDKLEIDNIYSPAWGVLKIKVNQDIKDEVN